MKNYDYKKRLEKIHRQQNGINIQNMFKSGIKLRSQVDGLHMQMRCK